MNSHRAIHRRWGNILVLSALAIVLMFGLVAFAVDMGYVMLSRTQLQAAADAAALAAGEELLAGRTITPTSNSEAVQQRAWLSASTFAQRNPVGRVASQLGAGDVIFGRLDLSASNTAQMTFANPDTYNAVSVRVRRTADINGEVPTFFARVLGINSVANQATATAAFLDNFAGFQGPKGNDTLNVLPFALDKQSWDALVAQGGPDNWSYDEQAGMVTPGSDGIPELNLYPQGDGPPGNRGTVDIGSSNNSTCDISRQIREGISAEDLQCLGGKLQLGPDGTLQLNGDTGISAGVKDDLAFIRGQPRIIPIFSTVVGPGNNAEYTIVAFVGIRIVEVNLTGKMSSKRVMIQPARVEMHGGIPASGDGQKSYFIFSPVHLVR